ncbi:lipopolysaccharide biosynthesis protein [Polyangium spumosum]|uniref:Oligosaccharide flippase family protein n=1 Tax=Polyangium spumosum TaxID=889282 RepID=A0A6N7PRJ2_9BACT|nr:oligosaccharide flippase family protein [Polyangium spumosum]MRG93436.1 oligosaccharide flippase family protein [Polyangium spumosum]
MGAELDAEADKRAAAAPLGSSITRLFRNASIYGFGQLVVSLISFGADPLLSYLLTRADFGLLGLTRTTTNLLANGYRLGLDSAVNRMFFDVERDPGAQRRAIGTINTFLLGWALLLTAAQELFGPAIYARVFTNVPYAPYGRFVAYALLCNTLIAVAQTVWGAQERAKKLIGVRIVSALLTNAIMFGLLYLSELGVMSVYVAQAVGPTIMLWVHLRFAYRSFGFAFDPTVLGRALVFGLPMVVHLSSHWALEAADRLLIETYLGRDAVGLYTVAYGSTTTLFMINQSVNGAYVPQFMRAHGKPSEEGFVGRAITLFLLTVSAATLGFVIFAPTVVRTLYSSRFTEAAPLTMILSLAAPMHAVYLVHVNALFHASRTRIIPVLTFLAGAANIGLNVWLLPKLGIVGAAWATLASYAILALLFWAGSRSARLPYEKGRLARMFVVASIVALAAALVDGRFSLAAELGLKLGITLAAPVLLAATGFLTDEERAWIANKRGALAARWSS